MTGALRGSEALVSLFQTHSQWCSDPLCNHPAAASYAEVARVATYSIYDDTNNPAKSRGTKPRALTMPSASSATTFVDTKYRGRSPCGRYHRARILHTTLRSSLPPPPRPLAPEPESLVRSSPQSPTTEDAESPGGGKSRLGGLRRMFSGRKPKEAKPALKPLLLPDRHGLRSTSAPVSSAKPRPADAKRSSPEGRRYSLALAGWLPGSSKAKSDQSSYGNTSSSSGTGSPPTAVSTRLRPLVLPRRSSESAVLPAPTTENANIIAWLLDCIQRDVIPQWGIVGMPLMNSNEPTQDQMLIQDGQPKCLVNRAKRRSALF